VYRVVRVTLSAVPHPAGVPFVELAVLPYLGRESIPAVARVLMELTDRLSAHNPAAAMRGAMMTFGGHKGSALSAISELLARPLIGDLTSAESMAVDQGVGATPCHGELILAFNPQLVAGL
jgi:hypothetical protein